MEFLGIPRNSQQFHDMHIHAKFESLEFLRNSLKCILAVLNEKWSAAVTLQEYLNVQKNNFINIF